ncbi:hypothetical protein [Algoriphagus sp. CAU 1675]|uniref:hypothetical protein n=1 Tax=Algoriphagus sp. CAU 1675 TaxID=3032597 RepID=UPI0023D99DAD|nr:hypothetical protein [Algoriphagus sp. CAU 1675]MDF2157912.1 hypothetical protein [Algoriphagus sp. CAU 1675]
MSIHYPELNQIVNEMSEGDEDFRNELVSAIYNGLIELQTKYTEGTQMQNLETIQQIRHKLKPTLAMFEFEDLGDCLQTGKTILETSGFGQEFDSHAIQFHSKLANAILAVEALK